MTDPLDFASELDISQDPVVVTPNLGLNLSPRQVDLDIYPLSPLHFEECSLETLWNQPAPQNIFTEQLALDPLKNRNGLKNLSWQIKRIVEGQDLMTYSKVADELIVGLELPQDKVTLKDEKNIRRRVYDALNVLVAAGVFLKQGKYVTAPKSEDLYQLRESENILRKRKKLKQLVDTCAATKNLYERNRMHNKNCQSVFYPLSVVTAQKKTKYNVRDS